MEEKICEVRPDQIRPSPFQPRREMAEGELEELASSIKAVGLIHPPVVREIVQEGKLLYYELIAGERRWRAASLAGLKTLNVVVRESSDEMAAKSALIENAQRVDLNPIEMAEGFRKLLEVFRMTQEEVADSVGKKRSTVANYLRLLQLPPKMRQSLVSGEISMGHAKALLALNSFELKEKLHEKIVSEELTVREAEKESVKLAHLKKKRAANTHTLHIAELEARLKERFGTKVTIAHGKEGKVMLHYYGLDDLDRLLSLLGASS